MKAEIIRESLIDCISIIPESREELLELHKLWSDSNIQFKKGGCCLHGDKKRITVLLTLILQCFLETNKEKDCE